MRQNGDSETGQARPASRPTLRRAGAPARRAIRRWTCSTGRQRRSTLPFFALIPLIAAGSFAGVRSFGERGDGARQEQVVFAELRAAAYEQSALEWQAITAGVRPGLLEAIERRRREMEAQLRGIGAGASGDELEDQRIPAAFAAYEQALVDEIRLLAAGRRDEARTVDADRVDPRFADLRDALEQASAEHEAKARTALRAADLGSAATLGLGVFLVCVLLWRVHLAKRGTAVARATEATLRESEARFRSLVQNSSDLITVVALDLTIRYQGESAERVLGYSPSELVGRPLLDLVHPTDVENLVHGWNEDEARLRSPSEYRVLRSDGSWVWVETLIRSVEEEGGDRLLVLNSRDVSERKELEEQLRHQAFHDPLTGLPNRALFEDRLEQAAVRSRRSGGRVAVLTLDLDDFKLVNDSRGHAAGDHVLVATATRIRSCLRASDTAARLGGDEFVILLEEAEAPAEAQVIAERLLAALAQPFAIDGWKVALRSSVGIASSGGPGTEPVTLLRDADLALYAAKERGGGQWVEFRDEMHATIVGRLELTQALRRALEEASFELVYQPIVRLDTGLIAGAEALVRWRHPQRGLLRPEEFIPLAEDTGVIVPLGRWALREACRQAQLWRADELTGPSFFVSVNVSARQFEDESFVDGVAHALQAFELPPESLILEFTESTLARSEAALRRALRRLKDLGVRVAIDDFGTDYSSLSYLQELPVDMLKIDKSFVQHLGAGEADSSLVRGIIELSRGLRMTVVAEGIERVEQLDAIRTMDAQLGQGYYLATPVAAPHLSSLMARQQWAGEAAQEAPGPSVSS